MEAPAPEPPPIPAPTPSRPWNPGRLNPLTAAERLGRGSDLHRYIATFRTGRQPKSVIFSPDSLQIYVPLLAGNGFDVIDLEGGTVGHVTVPGHGGATGFVEGVFSPTGMKLYLSQMQTGMVHEFALPAAASPAGPGWPTLERSAETGGWWPKVIALCPGSDLMAVSNWLSHDISILNVHSLSPVRQVPTGGRTPRGLAFTSNGETLLVACYDSGEIVSIDTADWSVTARARTGPALGDGDGPPSSPRHVVIDDEDRFAYVSDMGLGVVWVYDIAAAEVVDSVLTWYNPNTIALGPGGEFLYVSTRGPNHPDSYLNRSPENGRVYVVRTVDLAVIDVLPGGNQPTGLDLSPDGSLLAFSNFKDDTVEVYEIHRE